MKLSQIERESLKIKLGLKRSKLIFLKRFMAGLFLFKNLKIIINDFKKEQKKLKERYFKLWADEFRELKNKINSATNGHTYLTSKTQKELEETNRKLALQISEVERSRKRLYSLLENASEVISIYDQNGTITYESPSIKLILGFEADEHIGKNGFSIYDQETNNRFKSSFYELLELSLIHI